MVHVRIEVGEWEGGERREVNEWVLEVGQGH